MQPLEKECCAYCGHGNTDFITPCNHYFHLNCIKHTYFYRQTCFKCSTILSLEGFKVLNKDICFNCNTKFNLSNCSTCYISYCLRCSLNCSLNECCSKNFKNPTIFCEGCRKNKTLNEMCRESCDSHSLLCKKCWNLSVKIGKCILGCKKKIEGGYCIACDACGQQGLNSFLEKTCKNNCKLCDICYSKKSLIFGPDKNACLYCSEPY